MAAEEGYALSPERFKNFLAMERLFLANPRGPEGGVGLSGERLDQRPPIVAVLLDPLECGKTALAAVLGKRSTNNIQVVTAFGQPAGGSFLLGFRDSEGGAVTWTPPFFPAVDDAAKLQKHLSGLRGVGAGNVEVTLGLVTLTDGSVHQMWRWEIVFCGKFAGRTLPLLQVNDSLTGSAILVQANNPLEATGTVEMINEVVGVPNPSPLRAGCRIVAQWHSGIGYVPYVCEIRDFNDYGIFSQ